MRHDFQSAIGPKIYSIGYISQMVIHRSECNHTSMRQTEQPDDDAADERIDGRMLSADEPLPDDAIVVDLTA
jgi:hypothetical protein